MNIEINKVDKSYRDRLVVFLNDRKITKSKLKKVTGYTYPSIRRYLTQDYASIKFETILKKNMKSEYGFE